MSKVIQGQIERENLITQIVLWEAKQEINSDRKIGDDYDSDSNYEEEEEEKEKYERDNFKSVLTS